MSGNKSSSTYGPGFVAACVVIGAITACGIALLATGRSTDSSTAPHSTSTGNTPQPTAQHPLTCNTRVRGETSEVDAQGAGRTPDVTPQGVGELDAEEFVAELGGWEVSRGVVVPWSGVLGPGVVDGDGVRRCFGRSVGGAVYAAYSALAALADVRQAVPTVRKLMVPGANTDVLLAELRDDGATSAERPAQIAGYRIIDADRDLATVMLALRADGGYVSATLTLRWYDGDWKLRPPRPGDPVGAPFVQHRDLDDFVTWSGI